MFWYNDDEYEFSVMLISTIARDEREFHRFEPHSDTVYFIVLDVYQRNTKKHGVAIADTEGIVIVIPTEYDKVGNIGAKIFYGKSANKGQYFIIDKHGDYNYFSQYDAYEMTTILNFRFIAITKGSKFCVDFYIVEGLIKNKVDSVFTIRDSDEMSEFIEIIKEEDRYFRSEDVSKVLNALQSHMID